MVSYVDLDLSRDAGIKALMLRINGAARNVCGPSPGPHELNSLYGICAKTALDHALAQLSQIAVPSTWR